MAAKAEDVKGGGAEAADAVVAPEAVGGLVVERAAVVAEARVVAALVALWVEGGVGIRGMVAAEAVATVAVLMAMVGVGWMEGTWGGL